MRRETYGVFMAQIEKRGLNQWRARVRRQGHPSISKTFLAGGDVYATPAYPAPAKVTLWTRRDSELLKIGGDCRRNGAAFAGALCPCLGFIEFTDSRQ